MKITSVFVSLALLFLTGCADMGPPVTHPPELTFDHVPEIRLNVATASIVDQYKPPMQAPHMEHLLNTPLYDALHRLTAHQLAAAGARDKVVVTIEDASIIAKKLPMSGGVSGALSREPSERYDGRAVVRVDLYRDDQPDRVAGYVEATAERSSMLFDDMTAAEREGVLFDLTEGLANDIARSLDSIAHEKLGEIIL